jgi:hypothetical protein
MYFLSSMRSECTADLVLVHTMKQCRSTHSSSLMCFLWEYWQAKTEDCGSLDSRLGCFPQLHICSSPHPAFRQIDMVRTPVSLEVAASRQLCCGVLKHAGSSVTKLVHFQNHKCCKLQFQRAGSHKKALRVIAVNNAEHPHTQFLQYPF